MYEIDEKAKKNRIRRELEHLDDSKWIEERKKKLQYNLEYFSRDRNEEIQKLEKEKIPVIQELNRIDRILSKLKYTDIESKLKRDQKELEHLNDPKWIEERKLILEERVLGII